jgi:hypothetical protein
LCEIKSIRKPRRSTLLFLYNAKCEFYSIKRHTANNLKLQNIAMLLEPTVLECMQQRNRVPLRQNSHLHHPCPHPFSHLYHPCLHPFPCLHHFPYPCPSPCLAHMCPPFQCIPLGYTIPILITTIFPYLSQFIPTIREPLWLPHIIPFQLTHSRSIKVA